MSDLQKQPSYEALIDQIDKTYQAGQKQAVNAVQTELVKTHWEIGRHIVEFEQGGKATAEFGSNLLENLSDALQLRHGKGFSRSNLSYMRQFYLKYPNRVTVSHKLSWSHYYELLKIENDLERSFYEKQTILESWSIRELRRQKKAALFLRLAGSTDKKGVLKLAKEGRKVEEPIDLIREPYVLDFLKIPEPYHLSESELESRLIEHLEHFLLELGKGFAFIGRQYRITLGNRHHYVDLVFYHRILKCFVLIDLKKNEANYKDVGQMNMYLGYFESEENTEGDNPPIGIVLAKEKDELLIQYALYGITSQLFVSKYQLYLPNEEELRKEIEHIYSEEEE
jgi:predicted nuclease of restriction endonuclease-like (RecB) superfamily